MLRAAAAMPRYWLAMLRGSAVGVWMGITPGGPTAASFMSYGLARRMSRRRANFGRGEPEGVIAPETADHSAGTSAMLPMLALGIPGSATAAVMLGGLMIWGLNPGPMLFIEQRDFVWGMIASMYLGNVIGVVLALATVPIFAAMLSVSFSIIGPVIVVVCMVGAYSVGSAPFDLWLAAAFGAAGYAMKKLDYPLAPLVLAMVIGDKAEDAFRQSMLASNGSLGVLWSNWLVGTLTSIAVLFLLWPLLALVLGRRRTSPAAAVAAEAERGA
jgi:TctA family transporter